MATNPYMRLTPDEISHSPKQTSSAPEKDMVIRIKPDYRGTTKTNSPLRSVRLEEAILLEVSTVLTADNKYGALVREMGKAFSRYHDIEGTVGINDIKAHWPHFAESERSFTKVKEWNVSYVLSMVAKGAPVSYLSFNF
ncbi:MAG: hypothetical protein M1831_007420 [Alyxoria varia]|nr:MAG: hypothetical protein M1831_007420 [Alyxoria varia]